jgi:hypothetical protein
MRQIGDGESTFKGTVGIENHLAGKLPVALQLLHSRQGLAASDCDDDQLVPLGTVARFQFPQGR